VDDDVSMALSNMEAGEEQLWKRHDSLSSKWLLAKVAGIVFVFLLIFLLFVV
jgi:succinate dehydrogenase hydrophobic anchor subunit